MFSFPGVWDGNFLRKIINDWFSCPTSTSLLRVNFLTSPLMWFDLLVPGKGEYFLRFFGCDGIFLGDVSGPLGGVPNGWQKVPWSNPLRFKHHPMEGAGSLMFFLVFFLMFFDGFSWMGFWDVLEMFWCFSWDGHKLVSQLKKGLVFLSDEK